MAGGYAALSPYWFQRLGLSWIALSLLIVSIAYFTRQPRLLAKRPDGTKPLWAWLLFWPIYSLAWVTLAIYKVSTRDAPASEIIPGLWLGGRLSAKQLLAIQPNWAGVVDLALEFPRSSPLAIDYLSLAVLDGTAPSEAQLREGIDWIDKRVPHGPVLVHCALGHGRSSTLVAAYLLHRDPAETIAGVVQAMKLKRPGVALNAAQVRKLETFRGRLTMGSIAR